MGNCGAPTLTCVLLLLFMATLYVSVSSVDKAEIAPYNLDASELESYEAGMHIREERRLRRASNRSKSKVNNKKRKEKERDKEVDKPEGLPDDPEADISSWSNRRRQNRRRKPEGGRRPRPGVKKDGLPPGINRRMMKFAEKLQNSSTPFAARLFGAVTSKGLQNIVMSPLSVHTALTMTMLGAKARTEKELLISLGLRQAKLRNKKPHQAYKGLLTSLQSVHPDVKIYSANAVFVKPNIPLEDAFRQGLSEMYNATFDTFQLSHPNGPESPINAWVSNATRDRIQGLLKPGTITPLTALILINAIYFNATWGKPFTVSHTKPGQFNILGGGIKTVDLMRGDHQYGYANHFNTEVIELLYQGDRLAMYILLPNINSSITELQQVLLPSKQQGIHPIDRILSDLTQEYFRLYLPKFRIETPVLDLKQPLRDLGIVRAFDPNKADFSGISARGDLYISAVLHKAFIDVSESGTEAAAATAVVMAMRASFTPQKEVKVDRPFLFLIRDKLFKEILFIGAYTGQDGN